MRRSACFISSIDSSFSCSSSRSRPQWPNMRECRKYWLIAVSSFFSTAFKCFSILGSPFMRATPIGLLLAGDLGGWPRRAQHEWCLTAEFPRNSRHQTRTGMRTISKAAGYFWVRSGLEIRQRCAVCDFADVPRRPCWLCLHNDRSSCRREADTALRTENARRGQRHRVFDGHLLRGKCTRTWQPLVDSHQAAAATSHGLNTSVNKNDCQLHWLG